MDDFFDTYFKYTEHTEPPRIYHRWCAITTIAALLGRNIYIQHGHFRIYPNLYCMLIGDPGARKSTAIKLIKKLLIASGYETIAADKTSKEKFLVDLEGNLDEEEGTPHGKSNIYDRITSTNLWGDSAVLQEPKEVFVMADEFNEFSGTGNLEFYTTLGNLWDWDDDAKPFKQRLKNSKSVAIYQPTVNILGGNTPDNFARAFPAEIIGQGFLSRMILVQGDKSGKQYTFPPEPTVTDTDEIVRLFQTLRSARIGKVTIEKEAAGILDDIYKRWVPLHDVRFSSYSNRRFTQLLKLTLVIIASRFGDTLTERDVITANTILSAAENTMPKALGQFGKSKNSDVVQRIMNVLEEASKPLNAKELWVHVHKDLEKISMLGDIMQGLLHAEKVQFVKGKGWLPHRMPPRKLEHVDWSLLTKEEQEIL